MVENRTAPANQPNPLEASQLEANQRLSQSRLWTLQRQFFEQQGVKAWHNGKVPHYVTNNPFIANAYGKVVFGFLQDGLAAAALDPSQPVYLLELGAGSGRFAYHFLKQFFAGYPHSALRQIPLTYVMADFAPKTLDFWLSHPALKPFVAQGVLDFASFDMATLDPLKLLKSGVLLTADTLKNPLVVLANYFFDSIPQDLFKVRDGQLYETLVTLREPEPAADLPPADRLKTLEITYRDRPITADYYSNPAWNRVLHYYQQQLEDTSLLFPTAALDSLEYLRQMTGDRMLLLSADKGPSQASALEGHQRPHFAFHGSFSLSTNYHAIAQYVQHHGGQAWLPNHQPHSLQVCAFLLGDFQNGQETQQAYQSAIQNTGPDDFFNIKKIIEPHYSNLSLPQILGYLRFSGWDSNIFLGCWASLVAQVENAPASMIQDLSQAIQQVWEMYYWIGEAQDLPLQLSRLLTKMGRYADAIAYLDHSRQIHGDKPETWLHQAVCHLKLGQAEAASVALDRVLAQQPQSKSAQALKQALAANRDGLNPLLEGILCQPGGAAGSTLLPTRLDTLSLSLLGLKQLLENCIQGQSPPPLSKLLQTAPMVLTHLGEKFQLSAFERAILLLCAGVELEPNLRPLCAKAQGNLSQNHATLGLALAAFPEADWSVLSPQSPLHHWHLIHTEPGHGLTQAPLQIDRRILCYLLDEPALSHQLADLVTPLAAADFATALPTSYQAIAQRITTTWSTNLSNPPWVLIALTGADSTTQNQIAAIACDRLGFQLMALPAAVLPTHPPDLKQLQRDWQREAILSNSVLLLDCEAATPADPEREIAIALFLETLNTPVITTSRDRLPLFRRPRVTLDVPPLGHTEKIALWQTHLGSTAAAIDGTIAVLASQFKLGPTAIQTVCLQAARPMTASLNQVDSLPPEASDNAALRDTLWTLCRHQARPNLDTLAQRINTTATWEDLVLPDRQRQILADIAAHLNYRAQVYQTWGFAQKGDRGLGISALFYGESGTGKTMAAEVLAQACHLDLYRIDLSTVVSKYIGETEKNLRRIFDTAEAGGVILLFDEADALFGQRTEVKDSHDRHANIEVSYLLQRMETYQGLAILTSNLKSNLDQAFLRRLRFIVPFPFPDTEARADIWQRIFPAQTPTDGLDYAKLGQLKIAGGNIRNIALNAAFLAAQAQQPVTMGHIRQAAQRDYLKLEKLLTTEELQGW